MTDQYGVLPASLVGQRVTYRDVAFWGVMTGGVVEQTDAEWVRVQWDMAPGGPTQEWVPNLRPYPSDAWEDVGLCAVCHERAACPLSVDGTRCLDCQDAAWRSI
jgi:hypothetical protein